MEIMFFGDSLGIALYIRELIRLYWDIGKDIVTAQKAKGYG